MQKMEIRLQIRSWCEEIRQGVGRTESFHYGINCLVDAKIIISTTKTGTGLQKV